MKRRKSFLYLIRSKTGIQFSFKNKEIEAFREVGIKEYTPNTLLKTKQSQEEMVGTITPGSGTINKVVVNTRIIES